ncbi:hydrophobic W protein [Stigmatella aurantiaca]|uniref:Hydrophobic W protein n=1 Tax=Stigmatella aurantiaca TaxID=41 RepID=A0A1H8FWD6_STIAU|nr:hypothetical protein [Stigmatella aurantiaca]SEN36036.1 hydrophobic W protein [Stigmatella aurantiaca]
MRSGFPRAEDLGRVPPEAVKAITGTPAINNPYLSFYSAKYKAVEDTVIGQRWVDTGGINIIDAYKDPYNCFLAVTQDVTGVQHDHFLRERHEEGGQGAVAAINGSVQRFVRYFVDAAMAPVGQIKVWDGGIAPSSLTVDRNFFLFGRAVHLFQDSFSLEHAVRLPIDGFKKVRGIKTYVCTRGSEQHSHTKPLAPDFTVDYAVAGDVIWRSRSISLDRQTADWPISNVKDNALTAVEGMKDLWAAFLRTMQKPLSHREAYARIEAEKVARAWMSFDPDEVANRSSPLNAQNTSTFVVNSEECDKGNGGAGIIAKTEKERAICIYSMKALDGASDRDTSLHIPLYWDWKISRIASTAMQNRYLPPPEGFDPTMDVSGGAYLASKKVMPIKETKWVQFSGERLEELQFNLTPSIPGDIEYKCHLEGLGDQDWRKGPKSCGTRGEKRRMEGFAVRLTGPTAQLYDVIYECKSQGMRIESAKNSQYCGTQNQKLPLESLRIWLEPKKLGGIAHVADHGDVEFTEAQWVQVNGAFPKRIEALELTLARSIPGDIEYKCHLEGLGNQDWRKGPKSCGTRGEKRRMEGFAVRLTGPTAQLYDVIYECRVKDRPIGSARNGIYCGTQNQKLPLESLRIWLEPKKLGGIAHVADHGDVEFTEAQWVQVNGAFPKRIEALELTLPSSISGDIEYKCHLEGLGNQDWRKGPKSCGTRGEKRRMEGFAVRLTGPAAQLYDVIYECRVKDRPIESTRNGIYCGTQNQKLPLESLRIWLERAPYRQVISE